MPRKKKPMPENLGLQTTQRMDEITEPPIAPASGRFYGRTENRMNAYLREYENQCGNISATCHVTGVSRKTYYRWISGTSRLHLRFQRRIAKILPGEKLIDAAEHTVMAAIAKGDVNAAIFTLRTKGRTRGWTEKDSIILTADLLDKVANAYLLWQNDHQDAPLEEKLKWLGRFAEGGKVQAHELAAKVGLKAE